MNRDRAPRPPLDGCPEWDERLLESAFAPLPDARLDLHLAECARCRRARDAYVETADALAAAVPESSARDVPPRGVAGSRATTVEAPPRVPAARRASLVVAAAASLAALAAGALFLRTSSEPPTRSTWNDRGGSPHALASAPTTAPRAGCPSPDVRVSGRVVAASGGAPVSDAVVLLAGTRCWPCFLPELAREVGCSSSDGSFQLPRIPPTETDGHILFAVSSAGIGWTEFWAPCGSETVNDVEIPIRRGSALRIAVTDRSGKPVAGAEITAEPRIAPLVLSAESCPVETACWKVSRPELRSLFVARTDASGVATLEGLPPGPYDVVASAVGFSSARRPDARVDPALAVSIAIALDA